MLKTCTKCKILQGIGSFYVNKMYADGHSNWCKLCTRDYSISHNAERRDKDHRYRLYVSSKINAKRKGFEHNISPIDIPSPVTCLYLGIKLEYKALFLDDKKLRVYNAPSIDRIDSSKGYIRGNIQVISDLANRMKANATNEQLLAFAKSIMRMNGYMFEDE